VTTNGATGAANAFTTQRVAVATQLATLEAERADLKVKLAELDTERDGLRQDLCSVVGHAR
jgi:hypothetical protein